MRAEERRGILAYINALCAHRRVKEFSGIYVGYDCVKTYIIPSMNDLLHAGVIKEVQVGAAKIHFATANDFYVGMSVIVCKHPEKLHYIEEPKY